MGARNAFCFTARTGVALAPGVDESAADPERVAAEMIRSMPLRSLETTTRTTASNPRDNPAGFP
jgi:hypothetical protein